MLRRNFKLGAFLDFYCGVFFFASKQNLCKKLEHILAFFRASLHPGQKLELTYLTPSRNKLGEFRTSPTESCSSCSSGINVQVWTATFFSSFPGQVKQIMTCCKIAAYFGTAMAT